MYPDPPLPLRVDVINGLPRRICVSFLLNSRSGPKLVGCVNGSSRRKKGERSRPTWEIVEGVGYLEDVDQLTTDSTEPWKRSPESAPSLVVLPVQTNTAIKALDSKRRISTRAMEEDKDVEEEKEEEEEAEEVEERRLWGEPRRYQPSLFLR